MLCHWYSTIDTQQLILDHWYLVLDTLYFIIDIWYFVMILDCWNWMNHTCDTSHGLSDSVAPMGEASEAPPKKSRKESFLTPCCYIEFFTWYILGSHAKNQPEISKLEQNFRISKFCNVEILHHLGKWKIDIPHLILKIQN